MKLGRFTSKDLMKKINWSLSANFFTLDEAKNLPKRKLRKVIKLIVKSEGIKLRRSEISDIVAFIQSDFKEVKTKSVIKVWDFVVDYINTDKNETQKVDINFEKLILPPYPEGRFELMLN